jgi:nucleoid DNA-binding protein
MDKKELSRRVAGVTDQPLWLAGMLVDATLGEIQIAKNKGETVVIRGFSESKGSRNPRPQTAPRRP